MTTKITREKSSVQTIALLVIALVIGLVCGIGTMTLAFGYETVSENKDMACYSINIERLDLGYPFCLSLSTTT